MCVIGREKHRTCSLSPSHSAITVPTAQLFRPEELQLAGLQINKLFKKKKRKERERGQKGKKMVGNFVSQILEE